MSRELSRADLKNVPRAHSFQTYECGDPKCGPHFVALDANENPICEMVVPRSAVPPLVDYLTLNFITINKRRH